MIRNYATGATVGGHPLTVALLGFFRQWRPPSDLSRDSAWSEYGSLERLVRALVDRTLLLVEGHLPRAERAMAHWRAWNPAAGFFHQATRDARFDPIETTRRHFARKVRVA